MSPCLGSTSPAGSPACLHPPRPPPSSLAAAHKCQPGGQGWALCTESRTGSGEQGAGTGRGLHPTGLGSATCTPDPGTPEAPRSLGLSERGQDGPCPGCQQSQVPFGETQPPAGVSPAPHPAALWDPGTHRGEAQRGPGRVQATQGWAGCAHGLPALGSGAARSEDRGRLEHPGAARGATQSQAGREPCSPRAAPVSGWSWEEDACL